MSSSSSSAAERRSSAEQSDGRLSQTSCGCLGRPSVAVWVIAMDWLSTTTGDDGRRWVMCEGRNRLRKDERSPARLRVRATGVEGPSDGESNELSASVLRDTLVVDIRRRDDELVAMFDPSEKIDSRLGNVSGDMAPCFGDVTASSKRTRHWQRKILLLLFVINVVYTVHER